MLLTSTYYTCRSYVFVILQSSSGGVSKKRNLVEIPSIHMQLMLQKGSLTPVIILVYTGQRERIAGEVITTGGI